MAQGVAANGWKWLLALGVALYGLAHIAYPIMKLIHIGWMTLAFALGWINTRILLGMFFSLVIAPTGLLMRLFGKDLLNEKFDRSAASYWINRDISKFDPKHIECSF